jgi:integrase/recombinase XerD
MAATPKEFIAYSLYLRQEKGRSPRTAEEYIRDIQQFRKHLDADSSGGLPPAWAEVSANHIRLYLASIEGVTAHRVQRIVSSLRNWFEYLKRVTRETDTNPALEIAKPRLPKRIPKHLEPHQVAKLLESARTHSRVGERLRNWAFIAFLFGTGLRISEALGLTLDRVRYADGIPTSIRVIGKGDKERIVPLSSTAQRALHQWLKHRKLEGNASSAFVWVNTGGRSKGKVWTGRAVNFMLKDRAMAAGLGGLSAHKLRHSFATALAENRPLNEVQDLLGHASIATTQIYVHASAARLEGAVASLPDVLDVNV